MCPKSLAAQPIRSSPLRGSSCGTVSFQAEASHFDTSGLFVLFPLTRFLVGLPSAGRTTRIGVGTRGVVTIDELTPAVTGAIPREQNPECPECGNAARRAPERPWSEACRRHDEEHTGENEKQLGRLLMGGQAIDRQLQAWKLTPTEREVALELLKGRSHKVIAAESGRSERTVRQHAVTIYQKAGVGGRAELGAFFLEGLILPGTSPAPKGLS